MVGGGGSRHSPVLRWLRWLPLLPLLRWLRVRRLRPLLQERQRARGSGQGGVGRPPVGRVPPVSRAKVIFGDGPHPLRPLEPTRL